MEGAYMEGRLYRDSWGSSKTDTWPATININIVKIIVHPSRAVGCVKSENGITTKAGNSLSL